MPAVRNVLQPTDHIKRENPPKLPSAVTSPIPAAAEAPPEEGGRYRPEERSRGHRTNRCYNQRGSRQYYVRLELDRADKSNGRPCTNGTIRYLRRARVRTRGLHEVTDNR